MILNVYGVSKVTITAKAKQGKRWIIYQQTIRLIIQLS